MRSHGLETHRYVLGKISPWKQADSNVKVYFQSVFPSRSSLAAIAALSLALSLSACGGSSNHSIPAPQTFVLTVNSANPATGVAIAAAPADDHGVASGTAGFTLTYNTGTTVTLTAPAASGINTFSSWTGCTTASSVTCTVALNSNTTVTANYATPPKYVLTVNSVNPAGGIPIVASAADTSGASSVNSGSTLSYYTGTSVTLIAPPMSGINTFIQWTGCNSTYSIDCTVTMNADTTVTANYISPPRYTLTVDSVSPSSGVSIAASPVDTNGAANISTGLALSYYAGTSITLIAPPTSGINTFVSWSGCNSTYSIDCNVTLNGNTTVVANFVPPPIYTLTVNSTSPASGISVGAAPVDNDGSSGGLTGLTLTYNAGTSVTLTVPATSGIDTFSSWTGCTTTNAVSCTVTINGNTSVTANYTPPPAYTLSVNSIHPVSGVTINASPADNNGTSTGPSNLALTYYQGTSVTLTAPATADANTFVSWTGCTAASANICTVTMGANTSVSANYAPPTTYPLTVNSTNPTSGVTINVSPYDNVWNREGQILYPPTSGTYVLEPTLIPPEGNPQVLTSEATVWKMWYSYAGYPGILYAESVDGISWSAYGASASNMAGSAVVNDCLRSFVVENNGTYYLYCAAGHGGGRSIDEFTSNDGVHFTLANANVIQDGMGSWNNGYNDNSSGVIVDGTLYLFVEHSFVGIGLFTSTDFHTFTPVDLVITDRDSQGPSIPYQVNGTWYMWVGDGITETPDTAEYGIQRWTAPAITGPWTNSESGFDLMPQTTDEGAGTPYAEVLDPAVLEVGGKTYLYYSANQGTPENTQAMQTIKLALADMSMSDLVQTIGGENTDGTITGSTNFKLIYNAGTTVTLTAPTTSGSTIFTSWTGCTTTAANVCTVNVNAPTTVTANYN